MVTNDGRNNPTGMKEEALTHPSRRQENNDMLSRTPVMARFHPAVSGLSVGRIPSLFMILSSVKVRLSSVVGIHRMRAPREMETRPRASEIRRSRPGRVVTWKAAWPSKAGRTRPPIPISHHQCRCFGTQKQEMYRSE